MSTSITETLALNLLARNEIVCAAERTDRYRHLVESFTVVSRRVVITRRYYATPSLARLAAEMEIEAGRFVTDDTIRALAEYVTTPQEWGRTIRSTGNVRDLG